MVTVTVDDNGIGISDGEHESIFDDFHRARTAGFGRAPCRRSQ
jgi:signal transduction histidine kinase